MSLEPSQHVLLAASVAGGREEAVVLLELVAYAELGRKPWQAAMAGPGAWAVFQHPPLDQAQRCKVRSETKPRAHPALGSLCWGSEEELHTSLDPVLINVVGIFGDLIIASS